MLNLQEILDNQIDWTPTSGRENLFAWEWQAIKDSVDEIREHSYSGEAIEILRSYELWDDHAHYINEENLNKLFMEYC